MDQSKLSKIGQSIRAKFRHGRYQKVRLRASRLSDSEDGLSAGANSGGSHPIRKRRRTKRRRPIAKRTNKSRTLLKAGS